MPRARTWITPETSPDLTKQDCAIINLAIRRMWDTTAEPSYEFLVKVRTYYRPGMSAGDIIDHMDTFMCDETGRYKL